MHVILMFMKSACVLLVSAMWTLPAAAQPFTQEAFILELSEPRYGNQPVPVEVWLPNTGQASYPLIITQHGSTRDGHRFENGKGQTDVYSTRLMQAAVTRGFAVAALDAFNEKNIGPSDKSRAAQAITTPGSTA